jgi:hypothetical protein
MFADFVDSEGFADDVDRTKLVEDFSQACSVEIVDFEVPVFWLAMHQRVAHTAADEQRASARFVNSAGES